MVPHVQSVVISSRTASLGSDNSIISIGSFHTLMGFCSEGTYIGRLQDHSYCERNLNDLFGDDLLAADGKPPTIIRMARNVASWKTASGIRDSSNREASLPRRAYCPLRSPQWGSLRTFARLSYFTSFDNSLVPKRSS